MIGNLLGKLAGRKTDAAVTPETPDGGEDRSGAGPRAATRMPFLEHFDDAYAPLLGQRAPGFRVMFERLEKRCQTEGLQPLIVETGSVRIPDNWLGDGQSTYLWKEFAAFHKSEIHTVDLDPDAARVVRELCGDSVHAHTGDSVAFLHQRACLPNPQVIDLLYLDSFDFDPNEPFPSAFHHIKELIAVRPCLRQGSIIAIDDNFQFPDGTFTGKGYLAMQWFNHLGIECLHRGHQYIWQL